MASENLPAVTRPAPARPRLADWPERLADLVEARRSVPFAWGGQDCCLFAADAVLAITGADPLAAYRGAYSSEAEAERLVGPGGLEMAALALMASFAAPMIRPELAQRGDVAMVDAGNMPAIGVVLGEMTAVPGPDGLAFIKTHRARRAWAI